MSDKSIRQLLQVFLAASEMLEARGIAGLKDLAEVLFAKALLGERMPPNYRGFDVQAPMYGRIQVKHRHLKLHGRMEDRLHCGNLDAAAFDYLGAVIFNTDCSVYSALLVSREALWSAFTAHPDPEKKMKFREIAQLPGCIDVSDRITRALESLDVVES